MKKKRDRLQTWDVLTRLLGRFGLRILIYAGLAILFYVGITRAFQFGYSVFTSDPVAVEPGAEITVTITEDMDSQQIAQLLKESGVIRDEDVFRVQEFFYTSERVIIHPGTYTLNNSWSAEEILAVLTEEPETEEETTALAGATDAAQAPTATDSETQAEDSLEGAE